MKQKKRRQSIVFNSVTTIVFLLVIFSLIASTIGYGEFTDALQDQYADGAFRLGRAAAEYIDADRLDSYLAEGGTSEDYKRSWEELDKLCNGADVTFIYVIQPDLTDYGHITFVFSTVNARSSYFPYEVGYVRETTNDEYKQKYRELYEGRAEEELLLLDGVNYNKETYHITAMVPLKGADGQTKGILCVQRQTSALGSVRVRYVKKILTAMLILTVTVIIWQGAYLGKTLLLPIKAITEEASRFARENTAAGKKLTETIRNRDEIGVLADSVDTMEEQVERYVKDLTQITAEKERILTELDMAARIQTAMMPTDFPAFPDRGEFSIYASMVPARGVGGDFYDFFLIDDDHLCLVMADVSGKGIPGALFMMASKIILQSCAMLGKSAAEILEKTNEGLCTNNKNEMFVTVWLGILEISTGRMTAANAGHEYPVIRHPDGRFELLKDRHGFVIGGMEGAKYREYELDFEPGSKLFVYTDGVPEASDADNNMFGTERMLDALNEDPDASPEQILHRVSRAVDAFVGDAEPFDDITMLCMEYRGAAAAPEKPETAAETA